MNLQGIFVIQSVAGWITQLKPERQSMNESMLFLRCFPAKKKEEVKFSWVSWCTAVTPTLWEAQAGRLQIQPSMGNSTQLCLKIKNKIERSQSPVSHTHKKSSSFIADLVLYFLSFNNTSRLRNSSEFLDPSDLGWVIAILGLKFLKFSQTTKYQ